MPATLGMIVPDDQGDGPLDYELYRLGPWLERAGVDVVIETEDSPEKALEHLRVDGFYVMESFRGPHEFSRVPAR